MDEIRIQPPSSVDDLIAELRRVGAASLTFWSDFPLEEFFAPIGEAWSPADNVRHLVRAVVPVGEALRIPRWVLRLRFGRARRPSRGYETLVADYRKLLADGGRAGGRFVPGPMPAGSDLAARRQEILGNFERANATLERRARAWSEAALDHYLLPHPLLGPLTVREMLFFTLYHGLHHARNVARRKGLPLVASGAD